MEREDEDTPPPAGECSGFADITHDTSAQKRDISAIGHSHMLIDDQDYNPELMSANTVTLGNPTPPMSPGEFPETDIETEMAFESWNDKMPFHGKNSSSDIPADDFNDDPSFETSEFESPQFYTTENPEQQTPPPKRGGRLPLRKRKFPGNAPSEDGETAPPVRGRSRKKSSVKISKSELQKSMLVGTETKQQKSKKGPRSIKAARPQNPKKKQATVPKKKLPSLANIGSLGGTNTFLEAIANSSRAAQPGFTETRKAEALQELLASIPEENKKVSRIDKRTVESASKMVKKRDMLIGTGMRSSLHHYQLIAAAFMHARETGNSKPYGGLSADEMGFGKTVTMIGEQARPKARVFFITDIELATMISNPPPPDSACKTTLIVATPALVTQWMGEIKKHGEKDIFDIVIRYHTGSRISNLKLLKCADIILTTYSEVVNSYPKYEPPESLNSDAEKLAWWKREYDEKKGLLHSMMFYRVILDEAHAIKKYTSRTSIACRALMGKLRWAISGTPILNDIEELYPYFSFLGVQDTITFTAFKKRFCRRNSAAAANEKLLAMLGEFMIRRTRGDSLFGAPLIKLPPTKQSTVTVHFNEVERALYDIFHVGYIKIINGYIQLGTLEGMYQNVLTMLLRLRQLTAHIFLVQEQIKKNMDISTINQIAESLTLEARSDSIQVEMLTQLKNLVSRIRSNTRQDLPDASSGGEIFVSGEDTDDLPQRFAKLLRRLKINKNWDELRDRRLCQKCHGVPEDARVLDCMHVYCGDCLESLCELAAHNGHGQTPCRTCGLAYNRSSSCEGMPELSGDYELGRGARTKGEASNKDSLEFVDLHSGVLPSAKALAIRSQILEWRSESPTDKIIIFTQFRMMMAILARICKREKWGYCEYNGGMSHDSRTKSLQEFENDVEKTVLVASLKCGGVGLNLTMASRVICSDLWWNESVEQQSFCRVFRLGQTKETHIKRIVVSNTVDQRLIAMQAKKKARISAALGDDNPKERLTLMELLSLFGRIEKGDDGHLLLTKDQGEDEVENASIVKDDSSLVGEMEGSD